MALAEVELVPFRYVVVDASSTVTCWPADVVTVKLDVDTPSTVPDAPPAAGPDRALDPPAPAVAEGGVAVAEGDAAVAEGDVAQPETPITAEISAPATIQPFFLFGSSRRTPGRCPCSATVTESGEDAGGGGGTTPVRPELRVSGRPDVSLEMERVGRVSWVLVGS
jgi:hypothetical protein